MISPGIIIDNANNYGIVKTEAVIGFGPHQTPFMNSNSTEPLQWLIAHGNFGRSFTEISTQELKQRSYTNKKSHAKKKKHSKRKKCIYKLLKKKKKRSKHMMMKKYMIPFLLGFIAAKSLLIPIAFKALAFMSFKGLMMGFFSTMMSSVLSLKSMFNNHAYQNRKEDTKTQVEVIHIPAINEDHHYYEEEPYKRNNFIFSNQI